MKSIETNLKEICRRKGLSLTDVANRMGTSPSNLLSSVKGNPTISKLEDIAEALQVSIAELLTKRPEKALGLVTIDGHTYQLSKPSASAVQIPTFDRYDVLRKEVEQFIRKSIQTDETGSKMGMVETMEIFSLVYDHHAGKFILSLCYADGKTATLSYDKLEYCDWRERDTDETFRWSLREVSDDIINDLEGYIPCHLPTSIKTRSPRRKNEEDIDFNVNEVIQEIKETYTDEPPTDN